MNYKWRLHLPKGSITFLFVLSILNLTLRFEEVAKNSYFLTYLLSIIFVLHIG